MAALQSLAPEIEEAHRAACELGEDMYEDPTTGLLVFTEHAHKARGACCGNGCRHCPYKKKQKKEEEVIVSSTIGNFLVFVTAFVEWLRRRLSPQPKRRKSANTADPKKKKKKSALYTRNGDGGRTRVLAGDSVAKFGSICEAMGDVDELCVKLGLAAHHNALLRKRDDDIPVYLLETQHRCIDAGAVLCSQQKAESKKCREAAAAFAGDAQATLENLEKRIDALDASLPPLTHFVIPCGNMASLALHDARVVCRRAERHVWRAISDLDEGDKKQGEEEETHADARNVARFLNRLSDYLFAASRAAAHADYSFADVVHDFKRIALNKVLGGAGR